MYVPPNTLCFRLELLFGLLQFNLQAKHKLLLWGSSEVPLEGLDAGLLPVHMGIAES